MFWNLAKEIIGFVIVVTFIIAVLGMMFAIIPGWAQMIWLP
jgi:hypothetical protein